MVKSFAHLTHLLVLVIAFPFVSAFQLPPVRTVMDATITSATDIFEPFLRVLFGGQDYTGALLFEKFLLFVLLLTLVYIILGTIALFDDYPAIRWTLAIIVPLLGVRYMHADWLSAIFTQYQVLAIVITVILPFLLYFYFLYTAAGDHGIIRKLGWLIFIGIYVGLWSTAALNRADVYLWTMVAAAVCLLGDNLIHKRFEAIQYYRHNRHRLEGDLADVRRQIKRIEDDIVAGITPRKSGEERIKELERHHSFLSKRF